MKFSENQASIFFFKWFILVAVMLMISASFTRYILAKDYVFFIETPCDPEKNNCFVRDCNEYCPPNNLEVYSVYTIKAVDFERCTDNACTGICTETTSICGIVECNPDAGDSCSLESIP